MHYQEIQFNLPMFYWHCLGGKGGGAREFTHPQIEEIVYNKRKEEKNGDL